MGRRVIALLAMQAWAGHAQAAAPPHGPVISANGTSTAELRIDRQRHATLRVTEVATGKSRDVPLLVPDDVLAILIDRRFAFLDTALLEWAGTDLSSLRARLLAESAAAFAKGKALDRRVKAVFFDSAIAALVDRARILAVTGHCEEAVALLATRLNGWMPSETVSRIDKGRVVLTLCSILAAADRVDEADARYASFEQEATGRAELLNVTINHAMLQATVGEYREALATVDRAAALYASYQKTIGGKITTVPGSERYLAAIRACALDGLGRRDEAKPLLAGLIRGNKPTSLILPVDANAVVRQRAALCMNDAPGLAAALADRLAEVPLPPDLTTYLIPYVRAIIAKPALAAAARADPVFVQAARNVVRPLPPELAAAANGWDD